MRYGSIITGTLEICRGIGLVKDRMLLGWGKNDGILAFLDLVHDEIQIC